MPADLVPNDKIPALAAEVNSPELLKVLRHIQRAGFVMNGVEIEAPLAVILQRLAELGLVDPGYEESSPGRPFMWVSNGNGSRVLSYLTGLRAGPHYEIVADDLATWLERQGADKWWTVDGDPVLTGRLAFPCPADELASELRRIGKPLLVQVRKDDSGARGQHISADKLDEVVGHFADNVHLIDAGKVPLWSQDRLLYLCWKNSPHEWLLAEDRETTEEMHAVEKGTATDAAHVDKE